MGEASGESNARDSDGGLVCDTWLALGRSTDDRTGLDIVTDGWVRLGEGGTTAGWDSLVDKDTVDVPAGGGLCTAPVGG